MTKERPGTHSLKSHSHSPHKVSFLGTSWSTSTRSWALRSWPGYYYYYSKNNLMKQWCSVKDLHTPQLVMQQLHLRKMEREATGSTWDKRSEQVGYRQGFLETQLQLREVKLEKLIPSALVLLPDLSMVIKSASSTEPESPLFLGPRLGCESAF